MLNAKLKFKIVDTPQSLDKRINDILTQIKNNKIDLTFNTMNVEQVVQEVKKINEALEEQVKQQQELDKVEEKTSKKRKERLSEEEKQKRKAEAEDKKATAQINKLIKDKIKFSKQLMTAGDLESEVIQKRIELINKEINRLGVKVKNTDNIFKLEALRRKGIIDLEQKEAKLMDAQIAKEEQLEKKRRESLPTIKQIMEAEKKVAEAKKVKRDKEEQEFLKEQERITTKVINLLNQRATIAKTLIRAGEEEKKIGRDRLALINNQVRKLKEEIVSEKELDRIAQASLKNRLALTQANVKNIERMNNAKKSSSNADKKATDDIKEQQRTTSKIITLLNQRTSIAKSLIGASEQEKEVGRERLRIINQQINGLKNQVKDAEQLARIEQANNQNNLRLRQQLARMNNQQQVNPFREMQGSIKRAIASVLTLQIALRGFNRAKEIVNKLNKSITEIAIVTNTSVKDLQGFTGELLALGQELGQLSTDLADSAVKYIRQGKNQAETMALVTTTAKASAIASINASDATEYLTSILNGFNLTAEESIVVSDKLAKVSSVSATSFQEIAVAMSRTSKSAQVAGVSMDKLIGYIATVSSTTRASAETIGTSFKSIFARFAKVAGGAMDETGYSINEVEKALKSVGVALRDTEDTFRPLEQVIDEIALRWGELNDVERAGVATAIAGVRQKENFLVLMEEYPKAIKLAKDSMEALGTTEQQYARYLEGNEAKLKKMQSAFQELAVSVLSNETLGAFYDGLTKIANASTTVAKKLDGLSTAFTFLNTILIISFLKNLTTLHKGFLAIGTIIPTIRASMILLTTTTQTTTANVTLLTEGVTALNIASKAFFGVIGVVGILAITTLVKKFLEWKQRTKEMDDALKNVTKSWEGFKSTARSQKEIEDSIKKVKELRDEYRELGRQLENAPAIQHDFGLKKTALRMEDIKLELAKMGIPIDEVNEKLEEMNQMVLETPQYLEQARIRELEIDEEYYQQKIIMNDEVIKMMKDKYDVDLRNYKSLAQAKLAVEKKLAEAISPTLKANLDTVNTLVATTEAKMKATKGIIDEMVKSPIVDMVESTNQIVEYNKKMKEVKVDFDEITLSSQNFTKEFKGFVPKDKDKKELKEIKVEVEELQKAFNVVFLEAERLGRTLAENKKLQQVATSEDERVLLLLQESEILQKMKVQMEDQKTINEELREQKVKQINEMGKEVGISAQILNDQVNITGNLENINKIQGANTKETNELRKAFKQLLEDTRDLDDEIGSLGSKLYENQFQINGILGDINDKIVKLSSELEKFDDQTDKMIQSHINEQKRMIEQAIALLRKEKEELENDLNKSAQNIQKLKDEIVDLERQSNLEKESAPIEDEIEAYKDLMKQRENDLDDYKKSVEERKDAEQKAIDDINKKYDEQAKRQKEALDSQKGSFDALDKQNKKQEKLNDLQKAQNKLIEDRNRLKELEQIKNKLIYSAEENAFKFTADQNELEKQREVIEKQEGSIDKIKKDIAHQEELDRRNAILASMEAQIEKTQEQRDLEVKNHEDKLKEIDEEEKQKLDAWEEEKKILEESLEAKEQELEDIKEKWEGEKETIDEKLDKKREELEKEIENRDAILDAIDEINDKRKDELEKLVEDFNRKKQLREEDRIDFDEQWSLQEQTIEDKIDKLQDEYDAQEEMIDNIIEARRKERKDAEEEIERIIEYYNKLTRKIEETMRIYRQQQALMGGNIPSGGGASGGIGNVTGGGTTGTGSYSPPSGSGYATGTISASRGYHPVNEEGAELMFFNGGEKVIPHDKSIDLIEKVARTFFEMSPMTNGGYNPNKSYLNNSNLLSGQMQNGFGANGQSIISDNKINNYTFNGDIVTKDYKSFVDNLKLYE